MCSSKPVLMNPTVAPAPTAKKIGLEKFTYKRLQITQIAIRTITLLHIITNPFFINFSTF
jgi:hypothetical protein